MGIAEREGESVQHVIMWLRSERVKITAGVKVQRQSKICEIKIENSV